MLPRPFAELPSEMQNNSVYQVHKLLCSKRTSLLVKRAFDLTASMALLTLLLPLMSAIAVIILLDGEGGVLFRQKRKTAGYRTFVIYKFRTMRVERDGEKQSAITLKDDKRITRMGFVLRKSHLDELPQLVNVMVGDMSFVGPRPEILRYTNVCDAEIMPVFLMPAGITSPASLLFSNEAVWLDTEESDRVYINLILPRKNYMNLLYVKKFSILNDIKTMFFTLINPFVKRKFVP